MPQTIEFSATVSMWAMSATSLLFFSVRSRGAEDEEDIASDPEARAMTDLKPNFGAGILEDNQGHHLWNL